MQTANKNRKTSKKSRPHKKSTLPGRITHSYISSQRTYRLAKNTILTVIATAMALVLMYTIFTIIATPEFLVKKEVETFVSDYYENYFYPNILKSSSVTLDQTDNQAETTISELLEKYTERGFSRITLNQLLLFDNRKHYSSAASLAKYCDLDKTIVKIYPEAPFGRKNYRVEYNYSCNF